jgi:tetratricopeptide (TPR) repeat protein
MRAYFFLLFVLCLVSKSAFADSNEARAQIIRDQAKILGSSGNCTEAIKLFQKAYDINKEARDLYNISSCEFYLKKYSEAFRTSDLFLSQLASDEQLRVNTEQLKTLASKLNLPEVQKAHTIKAKALLVRIEELSLKAKSLPPQRQTIETTPLPAEPQPPAALEAPSKRGLALPLSLIGVAVLSISGELALESKTQNSNKTTTAREALRVGLFAGAGLSLAGAGAILVSRNKKNKPEVSARALISPRQVALVVSF